MGQTFVTPAKKSMTQKTKITSPESIGVKIAERLPPRYLDALSAKRLTMKRNRKKYSRKT